MSGLWIILLILLITAVVIAFFFFDSKEGTTEVSSGNFNSFIGNEIIKEYNSLRNYIVQAQNKVSQIITEEIEIPLTIRRYNLGEGVLAQAKMTNKYNVRAGGTIILNNVRLEDPDRWVNIIVHEILHVLGVGTSDKWEDSVITVGDEKFLDNGLFPKSSRQYDNLIRRGLISGVLGSQIPLSDDVDSFPDGGAHLDETIFDVEVMTPIADKINVISSLSIAMLEDLGFEVDYTQNEDYLL